MEIREVTGGVCAAKGFKAAGVHAGFRKGDRKDMAMVFTGTPANAAGVFTTNVVEAAPVTYDREAVKKSKIQAVVVNSGVANACTGAEGLNICKKSAKKTAEVLGIPEESVILGSTGVIGPQINFDILSHGINILAPALGNDAKSAGDAAASIITTDTHSKEVAVEFELGGKTCHMGAMAKGSGMIHPHMCTMLCYVCTDAAISHDMLQKALSSVVVDTFNMISVDGDMSTNDSLIVLANGEAGNAEITEEGNDYEVFKNALNYICEKLAKMLAGDGEGATALFEVKVINADTKENARTLAKSVICSNLTKAAIFGHDANWGRILCALGYSGVKFDPAKVDLYIESDYGKQLIFTNGNEKEHSEEEASRILSAKEVTAIADMGSGIESATAWGCDLTYDYVKINADYRS